MNRESDIMVAYPPWKLEYLEKKRKREVKLKEEPVPQWKRELLKRIQSKNLRMVEEQQQADILEEHIPKVSDNIFVTHQKKPPKLPPSSALRSISNESLLAPTSTYTTISVDNIIIIEKEDKETVQEIGNAVPAEDEEKDYPKVGLVHRLMGRFQTGKSDTQVKKSPATFALHHKSVSKSPSESSECDTTTDAVEPTQTPEPLILLKESSVPTPTSDSIQKSEPHSESAMQSDLLSPLLMSSAKPFSRLSVDNTDGFHHVRKPIRKVTAPTSTKSVTSVSQPPAVSEIGSIACPPEFADDLSQLHANASEPEVVAVKETLIIELEPKSPVHVPPKIPARANFKNGETLHSSGTEAPVSKKTDSAVRGKKPPVPVRRFEPFAGLQDRSNITPSRFSIKPDLKEADSRTVDIDQRNTTRTLPSEATVEERPTPVEPVSSNRPAYKENQTFIRSAERRNKLDNEFKKVVHESFDDSTLKSSAAKAANRIMQTSKTFKITPSKNVQRSNVPPPAKTDSNSKTLNKNVTVKTPELSVKSAMPPAIPFRKNESEKKHVSSPVVKTEPTVLSNKPAETLRPPVKCNRPPDNSMASCNVKTPPSTKQNEAPVPAAKVVKPPQVQAQPKTVNPPVNSSTTRSASVPPLSSSKQSIFGPKVTKSSASSNRGKSFTIDPSKFRRSSAQPPTVTATSTSYLDGNSTRTIVPGSKSQLNTDSEFGGDQPKTGKRKLTVDQITVIGGYVTLEKSCLIKDTKRKKSVTISFPEKDLETTYSYVSERSLLDEDQPSTESKSVLKSPGFAKDSTIGKFTPKYLLSLKNAETLDNEDDNNTDSKSTKYPGDSYPSSPSHATPLSDDNAIPWSDTTSGATDILF